MNKLLKPFHNFHDNRGEIKGIINNGNWEESNFIFSKKGSLRGNHYHKETTELIFVIEGKIEVILMDLISKKKIILVLEENSILKITPYTVHTFKVIRESKWINYLSKKFDKEKPDINYIK